MVWVVFLSKLSSNFSLDPFRTQFFLHSLSCSYLVSIGEIIHFDNDKLRNLVVINPRWMLVDVLGILLAPETKFPQRCLKDIQHGMIQEKDLVAQLKLGDGIGQHVVQYLESMMLCHRYVKERGNEDGEGESESESAREGVAAAVGEKGDKLLFPAMLRDSYPEHMWTNRTVSIAGGTAAAAGAASFIHLGCRFECKHEYHLFSAGFFPRIQVVAHTVLVGKPKLWQGGLTGSFYGGVDLAVTIEVDNRAIDMRVRAIGTDGDTRRRCAESLHRFCELVRQTCEQSCEGVVLRQLALSPRELAITDLYKPVAAYDMEALLSCKEEYMAPTLPSDTGFAERVADVLGTAVNQRVYLRKLDWASETPERQQWDIFISYDWGTGIEHRQRVKRLALSLKAHGIHVWFDDIEMSKPRTFLQHMAAGIEQSNVVLVCVTSNYVKKVASEDLHDSCQMEFHHAHANKKTMMAVVMEPTMLDIRQWYGPVALCLRNVKYVDMSATDDVDVFLHALEEKRVL